MKLNNIYVFFKMASILPAAARQEIDDDCKHNRHHKKRE